METHERYAVSETAESVVLQKRKIVLKFKKRENTPTLAISVSLTDRVVSPGALPGLEFQFQLPLKSTSTLHTRMYCSWIKRDPPLNFLFSAL